ncbi:hypothetical protein B0H19DRAFT_1138028 [Mycena capillaripes]|nr:hypothetical protein B0H19DRAFT_1138028 [Mycena capillaripes]
MSPRSHFSEYFPLAIDSLTYGIYSVLFYQSVQVLLSRRRPNYKFHLACMIVLFALSTIHIVLAYAWAFITDTADTAIYELFSLKDPLPVLYAPDDPISAHHIGLLLKIRFSLANAIADTIIIYRCYVIWSFNWRPIALLIVSWVFLLIGAVLGLLPLSGTPERAAMAVCVGTAFLTNVLGAGLAAGRIWWISQQGGNYLGRGTEKRYQHSTAILLESGLIYPATLALIIILYLIPQTPTVSVLVCLAVCYHVVGIAPTLIIVRVGLGVSTDADDVERGDTTMELQFRATEEEQESLSTKVSAR